jgi:phospholipid/cholesterol/gamma-HCH transport system substrate-binding protein
MRKETGSHWKLGMFVIIGLVLFAGTIFFVGKQKNLFGSTFHLTARFKSAGGLKEGNNVRFSGINIGTVNAVTLTDSFVVVDLVIKDNVQKFIKTDATATIGSDGLMGDKVLTINPGTFSTKPVKDGDNIQTIKAIDMDDIMASLKTNVDNAGIISGQLAEFTYKINNGNGILSRVISDPGFSNSFQTTLANLQNSSEEFSKFTVSMNRGKGALSTLVSDQEFATGIKQTMSSLQTSADEFALFSAKLNDGDGVLSRLVSDEKTGKSLDSTMLNIQEATQKLDENMEALQHNFLFRGFFKKKEKADLKKAADLNTKRDIRIAEETKKARAVNLKDSLIRY